MIKLKEARIKKGLNQTQLAHELNISQAQVSQFENGVNKLTSEQIIKLVKVLECSADYLLGLVDEQQENKQPKKKG